MHKTNSTVGLQNITFPGLQSSGRQSLLSHSSASLVQEEVLGLLLCGQTHQASGPGLHTSEIWEERGGM